MICMEFLHREPNETLGGEASLIAGGGRSWGQKFTACVSPAAGRSWERWEREEAVCVCEERRGRRGISR